MRFPYSDLFNRRLRTQLDLLVRPGEVAFPWWPRRELADKGRYGGLTLRDGRVLIEDRLDELIERMYQDRGSLPDSALVLGRHDEHRDKRKYRHYR